MKILQTVAIILFLAVSPSLAPAHIPPAVVAIITRTPVITLRDYSESDVELIAKTVWGESRGCAPAEQRLVVWTILNRLDDGRFGGTIEAILTAPRQFPAYRRRNPITPEIYSLCEAELEKWARGEKAPILEPYATTAKYLYFDGRKTASGKRHNFFRGEFKR